MAKTVVKAIPPLARHHQPRRFEQFRSESLHLLEMLGQTIQLIRGVSETELLQRRLPQPPFLLQIGEGHRAAAAFQLTAEPAGCQGESPLHRLTTG
jgi:hypothetical protein